VAAKRCCRPAAAERFSQRLLLGASSLAEGGGKGLGEGRFAAAAAASAAALFFRGGDGGGRGKYLFVDGADEPQRGGEVGLEEEPRGCGEMASLLLLLLLLLLVLRGGCGGVRSGGGGGCFFRLGRWRSSSSTSLVEIRKSKPIRKAPLPLFSYQDPVIMSLPT
jgi:hypothetical protein